MSALGHLLDADELQGHVAELAPGLLNTLLVVGERVARVVEVEAYDGEEDPASHAFRGMTPRTVTMFGPPGHLYVYRSYGLHWCANVVVGDAGRAAAVLLRAVEPVAGVEQMAADRPGIRRAHELSNGPGKLCAALGVTGADDGTDLLSPTSRVQLRRDGVAPPLDPVVTTRVGITRAVDRPWRFLVGGNPWVSKGRPARAA